MKIVLMTLGFLLFAEVATAGKTRQHLDISIDTVNLYKHVDTLVRMTPSRSHLNPASLRKASEYIFSVFSHYKLETSYQPFESNHHEYRNVIGILNKGKGPIIVVGAHYDVCGEQPGADDNASGVAGLLELVRILAERKQSINYEIQFVGYTNEEPPFFGTKWMGSYIHAKSLHESNANVQFMVSLEMIGYFTDEPNSQDYPSFLLQPFYPSVGNFIVVISNFSSGSVKNKAKRAMKRHSTIKVRSLSAPSFVTGVDFSDHRNYWKFGYDAIMITDTAFFRNKNYHKKTDTIGTLNFGKMAQVVRGVAGFLIEQAQ